MYTTSHNDNSNLVFLQQRQKPSSSIADLRQRAHVNRADTETYSVKNWINTVIKLFEQGDLVILNNDLESAYVAYMRGCSIMVEVINHHSDYNEIKRDPVYLVLKKKTNDEILPLLEDLALRIESWYRLPRQQQPYSSNNPYNTHFNIYPVSPTTTSVASYAFRPSHDPRNFPHYSLNDVPAQQQPPMASQSSKSCTSQTDMNQLAQAVSNNLTISEDGKDIQLAIWTSNALGNTQTIDPIELAKWITIKYNPPSILLIDIRPRDVFIRGCIKHQWIIQIDPTVLRKKEYDNTTHNIQKYLQSNPEAELSMFVERARFDLIVYYDQSSTNIEATDTVFNLRKTLESGQLRRPPMMLVGGFDAWQSTVGERGVFIFPTNASSSLNDKKHWFKSNSSTSISVSSFEQDALHVYDSAPGRRGSNSHHHTAKHRPIISVPQPLPTAPRKESITTRYSELSSPTNETAPKAPSPQKHQDLRPVPPSYPKLHRRRTFIDNPFNGFTNTNSKLYDVPPMAFNQPQNNSIHCSDKSTPSLQSQQQQRSSSAEPTASISRPSTLAEFHHVSTNNIHSSPTSSTFSQLNAVVATGTTGLKNLGNTCYMNSIIQCLCGTIPFARYFISGAFRQHVNKSNKAGTGGVLVESFSELLRVMWSENYNFISPMTFRDALVRFAPQFSGRDQQDSQEFLMFLLDGLHEDMNQYASQSRVIRISSSSKSYSEEDHERLPDWQASAMSWDKYLAKNTSIIVDLFQGQYQSRLTCLSCKQTSTTYNVFMSLSLPIPAKKLRLSSVTLNQCLDQFIKEETLDKEDAWKCPKCQKKRKALKQLSLTKLPDILLIHLKRFSMDGLFKNKLDTTVKCPTRGLDLSGYVPSSMAPLPSQDRPSLIYDLYAVSNHYGSLTGGHYTACVRDGYREKWHYFDDSKFSLCDENKVVTKAAYNLFYVRAKVK